MTMISFTQTDGGTVWVNVDQIALVRPATRPLDPEDAQTVIHIGASISLAVREHIHDVIRKLPS